jgi:hypothetical protein
MAWVIENSKQKASSFVVLLMIANHAHSDGTGAWAGYDTLAKESRITARQVINCVERLAKSGELSVEKSRGPYGTNLYRINGMQGISTEAKPPQGGENFSHAIRADERLASPLFDRGGVKSACSGFHPNRLEPKKENRTTARAARGKPRAQTRSARNHFDEEQEQRRRIIARDARRLDEDAVAREVHVGSGPEVRRS